MIAIVEAFIFRSNYSPFPSSFPSTVYYDSLLLYLRFFENVVNLTRSGIALRRSLFPAAWHCSWHRVDARANQ